MKPNLFFQRRTRHNWLVAATAVSVMALSVLLCFALEHHLLLERKEQASKVAYQMAKQLNQHLTECLSATYALGALIKSQHGDISGFEELATEFISFQRGIASLQLAPNAIVQHIVPLKGNEKAVGHNLLTDKKRSAEAKLAIKTHRLTLAGPFELKQGGTAVVGRLPIFLEETPDKFWGFSVALIKLEGFLKIAQLDELIQQGYSYELWRGHPDTGQRHVFAKSALALTEQPVTAFLDVPNGRWFLDITPTPFGTITAVKPKAQYSLNLKGFGVDF